MGEKKKKPEGGRKALYRKYRSKSLDEVVGQEHITKTLANAIKQGKISHAYLFTGPRGVGKTSIARIVAHEINQVPYTDEQPHLDVIEIDAASNRRIDDIRDLREKVHIAPVNAKYKVYIIDEVHMLTNESFNALLKTLEEPPEHVVFILATTEVHKLPATIVSRTQRHSFKSIPADKVVGHLRQIANQEGIDISDEALALLAEHGGGSFRDSISLLDQLSASSEPVDEALVELLLGVAPKKQLEELLDAARTGQGGQVITQIDTLIEAGTTPGGIAMQLVQLIRRKLQNDSGVAPELVQLMHELLAVSSAQYQRLKLEATLLGVASTAQLHTPSSTPPPKPAKSQPAAITAHEPTLIAEAPKTKTPPQAKKTAEKQPEKPVAKKPSKPADLDLATDWPKILSELKSRNSPLYTITRLAQPTLQGDELTLAFGFEFHRKRVDDSKHKTILAESVAAATGSAVTVLTALDKSLATQSVSPEPVAPVVEPAHASHIANIQDMMGGGEVVNA